MSFSSEQQRPFFEIKTAQTDNKCAHMCKRDAKDPAKKKNAPKKGQETAPGDVLDRSDFKYSKNKTSWIAVES